MNRRTAKISEPTANRLELYRRRWTAYFSLPFGVVLLIAGVWFIVFAVNVFSGPLGIAMGLLALITSLAIGISVIQGALQTLRSDGPALVFDEEGITYVAKDSEFIPWTAIERISSNEGDGDVLGIWFKAGAGERGSVVA